MPQEMSQGDIISFMKPFLFAWRRLHVRFRSGKTQLKTLRFLRFSAGPKNSAQLDLAVRSV